MSHNCSSLIKVSSFVILEEDIVILHELLQSPVAAGPHPHISVGFTPGLSQLLSVHLGWRDNPIMACSGSPAEEHLCCTCTAICPDHVVQVHHCILQLH